MVIETDSMVRVMESIHFLSSAITSGSFALFYSARDVVGTPADPIPSYSRADPFASNDARLEDRNAAFRERFRAVLGRADTSCLTEYDNTIAALREVGLITKPFRRTYTPRGHDAAHFFNALADFFGYSSLAKVPLRLKPLGKELFLLSLASVVQAALNFEDIEGQDVYPSVSAPSQQMVTREFIQSRVILQGAYLSRRPSKMGKLAESVVAMVEELLHSKGTRLTFGDFSRLKPVFTRTHLLEADFMTIPRPLCDEFAKIAGIGESHLACGLFHPTGGVLFRPQEHFEGHLAVMINLTNNPEFFMESRHGLRIQTHFKMYDVILNTILDIVKFPREESIAIISWQASSIFQYPPFTMVFFKEGFFLFTTGTPLCWEASLKLGDIIVFEGSGTHLHQILYVARRKGHNSQYNLVDQPYALSTCCDALLSHIQQVGFCLISGVPRGVGDWKFWEPSTSRWEDGYQKSVREPPFKEANAMNPTDFDKLFFHENGNFTALPTIKCYSPDGRLLVMTRAPDPIGLPVNIEHQDKHEVPYLLGQVAMYEAKVQYSPIIPTLRNFLRRNFML